VASFRKKPQGVDVAGQDTDRVRAPTEAEQKQTIIRLSEIHQIGVSLLDVPGQARAKGQTPPLRDRLGGLRNETRLRQRADTGVVVDQLLHRAIQSLHEPNDIRVLVSKLVVRPVAADYKIPRHELDAF
jgi:hypothetical protein